MSYDIDIAVRHPDGYMSRFEVGNMTYNVYTMTFQACGIGLSWLNMMPCDKALPILAHCWRTMKRNPELFKQYQAPNGWGTYEQFMPFLTRLYVMVRLHRSGIIMVS